MGCTMVEKEGRREADAGKDDTVDAPPEEREGESCMMRLVSRRCLERYVERRVAR